MGLGSALAHPMQLGSGTVDPSVGLTALGLEIATPVRQRVDGVQMRQAGGLGAGRQYKLRPFGWITPNSVVDRG